MVKNVLRKTGVLRDTALVIFGWLAFVFGAVLRSTYPVASLALLVIARVLPQALLSSKYGRSLWP